MKTANEIKKEIESLRKSITRDTGKQELASIKRDLEFNKQILLYLETEPRKEYIESEILRLTVLMDHIKTGFDSWKECRILTNVSNPYSKYLAEMNFGYYKKQCETLKFIVS